METNSCLEFESQQIAVDEDGSLLLGSERLIPGTEDDSLLETLELEQGEAKNLMFLLQCITSAEATRGKEGHDASNPGDDTRISFNVYNSTGQDWKEEILGAELKWNHDGKVPPLEQSLSGGGTNNLFPKLDILLLSRVQPLLRFGRKNFTKGSRFPRAMTKENGFYDLQNTILLQTAKYFDLLCLIADFMERSIDLIHRVLCNIRINAADEQTTYTEIFSLLADVFRVAFLFTMSYDTLKDAAILYIIAWNTSKGEESQNANGVRKFVNECRNATQYLRDAFSHRLDRICQALITLVTANRKTLSGDEVFLSSTALFKNFLERVPLSDSDALEISSFSFSLSNSRRVHATVAIGFLICVPVMPKNPPALESLRVILDYSPVVIINGSTLLNIVSAILSDVRAIKTPNVRLVSFCNEYINTPPSKWYTFHKGRRQLSLNLLKKIIHDHGRTATAPRIDICTILTFAKEEILCYFSLAQNYINLFRKKGSDVKIDTDVLELIDHMCSVREMANNVAGDILLCEITFLQKEYIPFAIEILEEHILSRPFSKSIIPYFEKLAMELRSSEKKILSGCDKDTFKAGLCLKFLCTCY